MVTEAVFSNLIKEDKIQLVKIGTRERPFYKELMVLVDNSVEDVVVLTIPFRLIGAPDG